MPALSCVGGVLLASVYAMEVPQQHEHMRALVALFAFGWISHNTHVEDVEDSRLKYPQI